MYTYYNQKIIHINKPKFTNNYLIIGNNETIAAANNIKAYATFKIYLYLAGNVDGYEFGLSRKIIMETYNISDKTYKKAISELEELGYLIKREEEGIYDFYLVPYNEWCGEIEYPSEVEYPSVGNSSTPEWGSTGAHCGEVEFPTNNKNSNNSNYNNNVADAPVATITTTNSDKKYTNMSEHDFIFGLPDDEFWKLQKEYFYKDFIDYRKINKYIKDTYNVKGFDCEILKQEINKRMKDKQAEEIANKNMYDDNYDLSDLPDFMNKDDGIDKNFFYNKQQKRLEEQEKEKNKKKIA